MKPTFLSWVVLILTIKMILVVSRVAALSLSPNLKLNCARSCQFSRLLRKEQPISLLKRPHVRNPNSLVYVGIRGSGTVDTPLFASISDDKNQAEISESTIASDLSHDLERTWNIGGLKKEVSRLTVRAHKKIGKASERLHKANQEVERLTSDPDVSLEELEQCPNVDELEQDLQELQTRLQGLNKLEVLIADIAGKKKDVVLPPHVAQLAFDLEIQDQPPLPNNVNRVKKEKGPRNMKSFRVPYRRYFTENKTEIRVGKQAEDNDELSLSPEHRDSADWWMHASGCPGSHVIIRCHDQNLDSEVVQDAAALAARQSKCTGNTIKVSMTRARDVKKPPGAKAGLVQLTGSVRSISVNMKEAQSRLDRLDTTVLVN